MTTTPSRLRHERKPFKPLLDAQPKRRRLFKSREHRYRRSLRMENITHLRGWYRDFLLALFSVDGYQVCVLLTIMGYCVGMGALVYHLLNYLETLFYVRS